MGESYALVPKKETFFATGLLDLPQGEIGQSGIPLLISALLRSHPADYGLGSVFDRVAGM
jgi:hypothetical protein